MLFDRQVAVFKELSDLVPNVRFGSQAALQANISSMSASEGKAAVHMTNIRVNLGSAFGHERPVQRVVMRRTYHLFSTTI